MQIFLFWTFWSVRNSPVVIINTKPPPSLCFCRHQKYQEIQTKLKDDVCINHQGDGPRLIAARDYKICALRSQNMDVPLKSIHYKYFNFESVRFLQTS